MIYSFPIPTLIAAWGMSKSEAGMIATCSRRVVADLITQRKPDIDLDGLTLARYGK